MIIIIKGNHMKTNILLAKRVLESSHFICNVGGVEIKEISKAKIVSDYFWGEMLLGEHGMSYVQI